VVEFVDIYPTLMALAQLKAPANLAGRSLCPLLEDPLAKWNGYAITQILRPADKRLARPVMGCSIRTARWRFTEWAEGDLGVELYDHYSDPMEFCNLAIKPDARAKKMMEKLRSMLREKASGKIPETPFNPSRL
jgi:uncharacterized sulfatase